VTQTLRRWALLIAAGLAGLFFLQPASAADSGRLVTPQWLQAALAAGDVLLLDASPAPLHAVKHIAGAVHVDVFAYAGREMPPAAMEQRLQRWGVSPGRKIVVMDQGGAYMAPRLFFDLYYLGLAAENLFLLDGGMAAWLAAGGAVTAERTPPPPPGSFRLVTLREEARVRLDEFLVASGDPRRNVLVDALEPAYHYGQAKFFDRAGHVPSAVSLPAEDFFNADKTFKPAAEIRRMAHYLGIQPDMTVHAHCGGGGAAAVPYFALRFLAGYPKVKLYNESQREWLMDDRELPFWTYNSPHLKRGMHWLQGWNGGMLRAFGLAQLSLIDVRDPNAYGQGHLPYALNLPAEIFKAHLQQPAQLAQLASLLGAAGVNDSHEAVVVSDGGLNPRAALAFLALERLGQKRVSLLMESTDDWGLAGFPLVKQPTTVGPRQSPQDMAVPVASYRVQPQVGPRAGVQASGPVYPRIYIAAGTQPPAAVPDGKWVHLAYQQLLNSDGRPKAAKDLLSILTKAGVPRYAEVVCIADDPGEAAVVYFVLKLMGWPDVKVLMV